MSDITKDPSLIVALIFFIIIIAIIVLIRYHQVYQKHFLSQHLAPAVERLLKGLDVIEYQYALDVEKDEMV